MVVDDEWLVCVVLRCVVCGCVSLSDIPLYLIYMSNIRISHWHSTVGGHRADDSSSFQKSIFATVCTLHVKILFWTCGWVCVCVCCGVLCCVCCVRNRRWSVRSMSKFLFGLYGPCQNFILGCTLHVKIYFWYAPCQSFFWSVRSMSKFHFGLYTPCQNFFLSCTLHVKISFCVLCVLCVLCCSVW